MTPASIMRTTTTLLFILFVLAPLPAADAGPLAFHLTFDDRAYPQAFTGRVYVLLLRDDAPQLQKGVNWFRPEPLFAREIRGWKPGQTIVLDTAALGYPTPLDRLPPNRYTVQAVMDVNPDHINFSTAPGNVYAIRRQVDLDPATTGPVTLHLDRVYQPAPFRETDRVRQVVVESKLLTAFHGRTTYLRAGVVLPASYASSPMRRYPVVYEIPGFSGTHAMAHQAAARNATQLGDVEALYVMLDPSCRHGHHVFADSANNGPVGKALIEELIPAIERRFRAIGTGAGRVVTGHSSGGWSSLWLQVTYPDQFAGCWSTAPDPVDFRDFQGINLYRPGENMFVDRAGNRRPIARRGNQPVLFYKPFSDMEAVMGHGGQLSSFEAVFSDQGDDGQPRRLWDRKTGTIDPAVAQSWERYDIRLVLERNWRTLGPRLAGKVHVYMGDRDTFYLEGATRLLQESLRRLGSEAAVELFAGKDHSSLMDAPLRARIAREMAAALRPAVGR